MSNENRTPAGVPTGGQFAASAKSEADVALTTNGEVPEIGTMIDVADLERGDRFVFSAEDGAADGDEIVTVTGSSHMFGTIEVGTEELDFDIEYYSPHAQVRRVPANAVTPGELSVGDKVRFGEGDDIQTVTSLDGDDETSIEFDNDESTIASYGDGDLFLLVDEEAEAKAAEAFATERKDGILTVTCLNCQETNSQPDKGLGRANLGAWKTRHQH